MKMSLLRIAIYNTGSGYATTSHPPLGHKRQACASPVHSSPPSHVHIGIAYGSGIDFRDSAPDILRDTIGKIDESDNSHRHAALVHNIF